MPWTIPQDLQYFKKQTLNQIVVMGRKTYESIGQPLPGRINILLSSSFKPLTDDQLFVLRDIDSLYPLLDSKTHTWRGKRVFVIGGETLFKHFLTIADSVYLTIIEEDFIGDTHFPLLDSKVWLLTSSQPGIKDKLNPYNYHFDVFKRRKRG